jgi:hypothetical protein
MKLILFLATILFAASAAAEPCYDGRWGRAPILKQLKQQGLSTNVRVTRTGDSLSGKSAQFLVQNRKRHDVVYTANVLKKTRVAALRTPIRAITVKTAEGMAINLRRELSPAGRFVKRRIGSLTQRANYRIKSSTDRNESIVVTRAGRQIHYDR